MNSQIEMSQSFFLRESLRFHFLMVVQFQDFPFSRARTWVYLRLHWLYLMLSDCCGSLTVRLSTIQLIGNYWSTPNLETDKIISTTKRGMYIHTGIKLVVCLLDSRNDMDRPLCQNLYQENLIFEFTFETNFVCKYTWNLAVNILLLSKMG